MLLSTLLSTTVNAATYTYGFEYDGYTTTPIVGPNQFANLTSAQTAPISYDAATFSGGAVLTDATSFPAHLNYFPNNLLTDGTYDSNVNHNAYGTSNMGSSAGLMNDLIAINFLVNDHPNFVSFTLFNGQVDSKAYTITAFDSANNAYTPYFTTNLNSNVFVPKSNSSSKTTLEGYGSFEQIKLSFTDIAYITIRPTACDSCSSAGWDFLIDDVTFIGNGIAASVPEPESYAMMLAGLGLMGLVGRRRKVH
jgi:hypothetical protein